MSRTKLSLSDATEIVMGRKVRVELRDGRTGIGRVHIRTRDVPTNVPIVFPLHPGDHRRRRKSPGDP